MEARYYDAKEIILKELEECSEIIFIQEGTYNVGYEINYKIKHRLRFG